MRLAFLAGVIGATMISTPALALCSYGGVENARTTVAREFHDSRWVARVRIVSEKNNFAAADQSEDAPWSLYELQMIRAYKGQPPETLHFFTYRNCAGFYFDKPWAGPDIGGEYLVFLNPTQTYPSQPSMEKATVFVNYACGQSKPWTEVSPDDLKSLRRLADLEPRMNANKRE